MNQLSLRNNQLKFKTFRKITDHFRGVCAIFLKLLEEIPGRPQHVAGWELETRGSGGALYIMFEDHVRS